MESITTSEYKELLTRLDEINRKLSLKEKATKEVWLDNQEFMQLLKISRRTAQSYRDDNKLAFSIIGNKIFYKLSDIEDMLNRHYRKRLV